MSEDPSTPDPAPPSDASDDKREEFGPLSLRRLTKEDGRALILYSRVEEGEEGE